MTWTKSRANSKKIGINGIYTHNRRLYSIIKWNGHVFIVFLAFAAAADKEIEDGNTYAKCVGQSGKCLFARKGDDEEKKDLNKEGFVIEVDYVKQLDRDGNDVGKPVNSLASQTFTFSDFREDSSYGGNAEKDFWL